VKKYIYHETYLVIYGGRREMKNMEQETDLAKEEE